MITTVRSKGRNTVIAKKIVRNIHKKIDKIIVYLFVL